MKKLFLVGALALSTVFAASAQDLTGKWFVGGNLGYNNTKVKSGDVSVKSDSYTILPMLGTFISSDVAVGAQLGYAGSKDGDLKTTRIVVAPLVRKYWNISGGFNFFGQASLPIAFGNTKGQFDGDVALPKVKRTDIHLELAPGFDYILNDRFSIETSFNILSLGYSQKKAGSAKTTDFGLSVNPSDESRTTGGLQVGFKFLF